jgi:hypothetical protein
MVVDNFPGIEGLVGKVIHGHSNGGPVADYRRLARCCGSKQLRSYLLGYHDVFVRLFTQLGSVLSRFLCGG